MPMPHTELLLAPLCTMRLCASATAGDSAGKVTTVAVPGGGKPVTARTSKDGTIHLLFD
jgi:hypothetical protein